MWRKSLMHPSNVVDAKEETGRGCSGFYGPEISNWKARPPTLLQVLPKWAALVSFFLSWVKSHSLFTLSDENEGTWT